MATTQKVFVSPGVYTTETDLSFVAQSVGVTTLGIVGETLKGPAFEPIFITNYDEFTTIFGPTSPEKFVNTQIPKYEAAYIAKSYLQQSNQLFVTRILGLSGYDAGPSWSITTIANVNPSTIGQSGSSVDFSFTFTGTTGSTSSTITLNQGTLPDIIWDNLNTPFTQNNGTQSSFKTDITNQLVDIMKASGTTSGTSLYVYGAIDTNDLTDLTGSTFTGVTNALSVSDLDLNNIVFSAESNDEWYYATFNKPDTSLSGYTGFSFTNYIMPVANGISGNTSIGSYTGTVSGSAYFFSGGSYTEYDNLVVATLRSRGISLYNSTTAGPRYQVSGLTDVVIDTSGAYSAITSNPFSTFAISGITIPDENGVRDTFSFETSFQSSDSEYITKVLSIANFTKSRFEVPLFVEEYYQTMMNWAYNNGYIRGINPDLTALPEARDGNVSSIANNLFQYQSPKTPWVVSELRGNKVYNLFKFISISDGDSANTEIKISIMNMSFNNSTFDVMIRDFFDTDANPVVLEKFTNCTMDPNSNSFVAKKIGSSDGEYSLNSAFVMIELSEEYPIDALPCGFEGYVMRDYSGDIQSPIPIYKTEYYFPGQVIYNPPFGTTNGGSNQVTSAGDNVRRTFLGFSNTVGIDESFLEFKGFQNIIDHCQTNIENPWNYKTKGFHMDSGATVVTIGNTFMTSGQSAFEVGDASFNQEPTSPENPYFRLFARKFTVCLAGGFDGWDIYRESRTNTDDYILGGSGYLKGACASSRYPTATGWGAFRNYAVGDQVSDWANTDYYAYQLGISTFANPEATNINVFVSPGIDYVNNSGLAEYAVDMVEDDRADSIYIVTTPDYDMFDPSTVDNNGFIYPTEAVNNLENTGIDSNYTATYYPWILVRDTVNNTQLYIPSTGEVCRNLALTDNIAFPWYASAGYTRGLVNSIKARKKLTQEDRDTLYKGRINPIATFSDVGTVIWGNKTLQVAESALDRLNVRRLLLQARKLISAVAVRLLFEQNDEIVRQQFLDAVNPIMDSIRRDRGVYDFRVTVSSSPEDLDRNTLTGKIYLKPTKALEFIDIEFLITPAGATFENI
jgi:hypothetical protein